MICPICGKFHTERYSYNGIPLLACPDVPDDKIVFSNGSEITLVSLYPKSERTKSLKQTPLDQRKGGFYQQLLQSPGLSNCQESDHYTDKNQLQKSALKQIK